MLSLPQSIAISSFRDFMFETRPLWCVDFPIGRCYIPFCACSSVSITAFAVVADTIAACFIIANNIKKFTRLWADTNPRRNIHHASQGRHFLCYHNDGAMCVINVLKSNKIQPSVALYRYRFPMKYGWLYPRNLWRLFLGYHACCLWMCSLRNLTSLRHISSNDFQEGLTSTCKYFRYLL